jgi:hypothetical protein
MNDRTGHAHPPWSAFALVALVALACGGAEGADLLEPRDEPPAIERYVDYASGAQAAARVCGWLTLPSGQSAYYPCAGRSPRSPVSDPPVDDHDGVGLPAPGRPPPGSPPGSPPGPPPGPPIR